jgi:hypothetical protein
MRKRQLSFKPEDNRVYRKLRVTFPIGSPAAASPVVKVIDIANAHCHRRCRGRGRWS